MSKNLTRKGLALATALSFGLTGLSALPASAATSSVSIEPTTGTGFSTYDLESFDVSTSLAETVTQVSADKLAIEITNPKSYNVTIAIAGETDITSYTLTNPDEEYTAVTTDNGGASLNANDVTIDFSDVSNKNYTHAVINLETVVASADVVATVSVADGGGDVNDVVGGVTITATTYDLGTDTASIGFTSFIDTDEDKARTIADTNQSKIETIKFYDPTKVVITPRFERFPGANGNHLNAAGQSAFGYSIGFSPALNVEQITWAPETGGGDGRLEVGIATGAGPIAYTDVETAEKAFGSETYGFNGRLYGKLTKSVLAATSYTLAARYATEAEKSSSSFKALEQSDLVTDSDEIAQWATAAGEEVTAPEASTVIGAVSNGASAVEVRADSKAVTYTAHADVARANVPVFAVVKATVVASGSSLTIGSKKLGDDESTLVTGVTNADGEFSVNVVSGLAKKGEQYSVQFYVVKVNGTVDFTAVYNATYIASEPATVAATSDVLSGSTISAKFTVKDKFGQLVSTTSAGKALFVELTRTSTETKSYVAVTSGSVTFSFANTLVKGDNEGLTAQLGTGGANKDDFVPVDGKFDTATVYNPEATAEVVVDAVLENAAITYDKFITGAVSATNEAPLLADAIPYSGTIVDATGAGVPGAVVTVAGSGLQFQEDGNASGTATTADTGDFYKDTITLAAGTDGTFNLSVWAHKITTKGITITVTSGGKSATTKLTTTSNDNVVADDLAFTWDAPKHPGVDTTYITTVKLTDIWGNPVSGARITVDAAGALLINGDDTVTKTTSASGVVRVYFRSLTKTDGVANITATLEKVVIAGITLDNDSATAVSGTSLDITAGETFENVISADVTVGPDAAAVAGKKAGTAKVTAYNSKGKTVTVYVAGKKVATKKATSGSYSFTVKAKAGAVVKVKVGTSTFFNAAVN